MAQNAYLNLFLEDEVCKSGDDPNSFVFGVVLENSEYVNSDDEISEGDVKRGTVRIAWHPDGKETVEDEDNVILTDRSLMPGDVVRRTEPNSQCGFITDTRVKCHVHIKGTNKYIYNIDSKELSSILGFEMDPGEVTMDSWIGNIVDIHQKLTIVYPDGARCKLMEHDFGEMDLVNREKFNEFSSEGCFYRGQIFHGEPDEYLGKAEWLVQTSRNNRKAVGKGEVYVQIEETEADRVDVHWLCKGFTKVESITEELKHPPNLVEKSDFNKLKSLDKFYYCSVQIGDKMRYKIKDSDILTEVTPRGHLVPNILNQKHGFHHSDVLLSSQKDASGFGRVVSLADISKQTLEVIDKNTDEIVLAKIKVEEEKIEDTENSMVSPMDVDDGEEKEDEDVADDDEYEDIDSTNDDILGHCSKPDEKALLSKPIPNTLIERPTSGSTTPKSASKKSRKLKKRVKKKKVKPESLFKNIISTTPESNVVVEICYTYTVADVKWQDGTEEKDIPSPELFPVHHLDELEYFPGDFIMDSKDPKTNKYGVIVKCDHTERLCCIKWMSIVDLSKGERPDENAELVDVSAYDIKDHPDFKFRPGQVVIRVSEPLNSSEKDCAVGQVTRLDPSGALIVSWANGLVSRCYPQELYIINEEYSDDDSEDTLSDFESDDEACDSDSSWETENEEEVSEDQEPTKEAQLKRSSSGIKDKDKIVYLIKNKKEELDGLLSRARSALSKLEEVFVAVVGDLHNPEECYSDLLALFRRCKELEKILGVVHIRNSGLVDLIETVKDRLEYERKMKLNKHLIKIFESRHCSTPNKVSESTQTEGTSLSDCGVQCINDQVNCLQAEKFPQGNISDHKKNENHMLPPETKPKNMTQGMECLKDLGTREVTHKSICIQVCQQLCQCLAQMQDDVALIGKEILDSQGNFSESEAKKSARVADASNLKLEPISSEVDRKLMDLLSSDDEIGHILSRQKTSLDGISSLLSNDSESAADNTTSKSESLEVDNSDAGCQMQQDEVDISDWESQVQEIASDHGEYLQEGAVHSSHKFKRMETSIHTKNYMTALRKDIKLLMTSLPKGICVKGFDDRMDLFSVMIVGPSRTPYEDALFFFDVYLPSDYPSIPPKFHYIAFCSERLNPNLYEDGNVCVSLLGTWEGKNQENWTSKSNLLQVLVSIQGLILVSEPYYNEAGYERQRGTVVGQENSKVYNEMAILKLVQSVNNMVKNPPPSFKEEVKRHFMACGTRFVKRIEYWTSLKDVMLEEDASIGDNSTTLNEVQIPDNSVQVDRKPCSLSFSRPEFPFVPCSRGFSMAVKNHLSELKATLANLKCNATTANTDMGSNAS